MLAFDLVMKFKAAVEKTPHLKNSYQEGLQALRTRDRFHVKPKDPRKLLGSVDIDTSLRKVDPNGNRWDFGIAYQHTNCPKEFIYWTEFHTANDSQVKVVIKKVKWLQQWLKGDGKLLSTFEREFIWVSSGATLFNLTGPQKKQMAVVGLRPVGSTLSISNKR